MAKYLSSKSCIKGSTFPWSWSIVFPEDDEDDEEEDEEEEDEEEEDEEED